MIDWRPFERYLSRHLKPGPAAAGQPPYPALVMFKILIWQFLYNLSNDGASAAIGDRISFIHFVGPPFNSSKPDGSTICRFHNKLLAKGRYDHLLNLFNHQLESNGLLVKQGVAVDTYKQFKGYELVQAALGAATLTDGDVVRGRWAEPDDSYVWFNSLTFAF